MSGAAVVLLTGVMNRTATLRCLAAAALFGISAPAASVLAGDMDTLVLAGLLYLGAAMAVAPAMWWRRPDPAAARDGWKPLAVAVVVGGAVGPVAFVAGLSRVDAASASILLNLELAATVVLAAVLLREHLGGRVLAGAATVTAAGILLVWDPGVRWDLGGLLIAGACGCWGVDNVVTARIDRLAPEAVVFAKGLVAGSANVILGVMLADGGSGVDAGRVVAALAVGAAGYGVSITLWVKGARDLGAARGQVLFATAPFIGAVGAWTVLGDPVTAVQVAAVVLAAAGVSLSLGSAHDHRHVHQPVQHEHEHQHPDVHHCHSHVDGFVGRHDHPHDHGEVMAHAHPHVPDLHHRHLHRH